jgi:ligand-binding sensor domain-containing protein/signal transduction histidine kinase
LSGTFMRVSLVIRTSLILVFAGLLGVKAEPFHPQDRLLQSAPFVCRTWRTEDGLPQDSVSAIVQTRDGYLWVGTSGGLARFDGVRFELFELEQKLPNPAVRALLEDRSGNLWIGTAQGLYRLSNGRFTRWTTHDGLAGEIVNALAEDGEGTVWIGTTQGLSRWRDGRLETDTNKLLAGRWIRGLTTDQRGALWVASVDGELLRWNGNDFVPATNSLRIQSLRPTSLMRDKAGIIWVCDERRVIRVAGDALTTYGPQDGLTDGLISCVLASADGTIWVGMVDQGLCYLRDGKFHALRQTDGLSDEAVRAVMEDREGNLWVGNSGGGLIRLRPKDFKTLRLLEGQTELMPLSLAESEPAIWWVGTLGRGFYELAEDGKELVGHAEPLPSDSKIHLVFAARDGSVWRGGGKWLFQYRGGRLVSSNNCDLARCFCDDGQGGLWVGQESGTLLRLRDGKIAAAFTNLLHAPLTALRQGADGTLWIGSYGGGLGKFRDGECAVIRAAQGLGGDIIRALYLDSRETLWIGTESGGLSRLRDGQLKNFNRRQGLMADTILQILEDDHGNLWLGTHRGILRVSHRELEELGNGGVTAVHPRVWGRSDGLLSEQCVAGFNSCLKTRSGLLCFATARGIVVMNSNEHEKESAPPGVRLEQVLVNGEPQILPLELPATDGKRSRAGAALEIPPGKLRLDFRFTGFQFAAPDRTRFRHRLAGLDADWVDTGAERTASYWRVPPGRYRFEVEAHNGDGVWNEPGASVALVILPHFWQTWWFIALVGTGLVTGAAGTARAVEKRKARAQLRQLELQGAMDRERARIAQDLHDDLGAGLTEIGLTSEMVQDPTVPADEARGYLKEISTRARELAAAMDEIVWAVNPRNDRVPSVAAYFSQYAERLLKPAGISCRLDIERDLPASPLKAEQRHNLFLAFKEALANVVKHSRATEMMLRIGIQEAELVVGVADNGSGFTADAPSPGADGLANMRERLGQMGGVCEIVSAPGQGTKVVFRLPLGPDAPRPHATFGVLS